MVLLGIVPMFMFAQNITDQAVMNDNSADIYSYQEDNLSTVDDSIFLYPDRIRYDNRCIQIEGKDVFVYSGAFHYYRVPQPLWASRFSKLKEAGFNCVETYIPWNWHEQRMPKSVNDESCLDMRQLEDFLEMAEDFGFYVIARPGPYICAEWSGGGFPQWLMRKKPAKTKFEAWLQSNDPEFMRWNEHWYKAVCRVVAPHQITHKEKGKPGVILFQVENEFNRIKWFPSADKKDYLVKLTELTRKYGIDVPIITCWTSEARNVPEGPLNGVVDMVNSYPRWEIEKNFGRLINQQLKSQPGKPLISGELQGGWYSDVAGKLSWKQDGVAPVQTQNITLYALQRGFCGISYYMTVGGTNFDDWASRQTTTTYDFAAAISENGSVNERFRRFRGLAELLKEHGTKIARAVLTPVEYSTTDADVKLALRQAANGDRYYFIRTEEHTRQHFGTLQTSDLTLDYALEPFGAMVYYLPAGSSCGEWWPKLPETMARPTVKADTIRLLPTCQMADPLPTRWTKLKKGEHLDEDGIYGRHFVYYRTKAPEGEVLEIGRIGDKLINGSEADEVLVSVHGKIVPLLREDAHCAFYQLPGDAASGNLTEVLMLFESKGLHHHTKQIVEEYWSIGINYARCAGKDLKLEYAYTEKTRGIELSKGKQMERPAAGQTEDFPLTWHTYSFVLPLQPEGVWFPYHLRLEHSGNGFVYLNGHCIGRCWQKGPQYEYYLPECWLNFGGENHLVISLRPTADGAEIRKAEIVPITQVAEKKKTDSLTMDRLNGRWGDQGDGTYRNPIIAADYSDPDPLRVGDDYYLVASTFESFPGVSILHSKDLVNWTTIGAALTDLGSVDSAYTARKMERYNGGVYAPTISYHNGKYYIYVNLYTDGFYMATADNPEGPWKSGFVKDKYGRLLKVTRWSDPCPFWDEDGKAYLVASHPGRKYWYSYIFQMSEDGTTLLDADSAHMDKKNFLYQYPDGGTVISPYHSSEGNRIFKRNGYYYLQHIEFTNQGQGEGTYIFRSRKLYGTLPDGTPGRPGNPGKYEVFTVEKVKNRDSLRIPGQGGYVDTPDGRWFWIGQFTRDYACGRPPHLLPVTWIDDWPVIGVDVEDKEGQMAWQLPKPVQGYALTLPQGSDDFDKAELHPQWMWNHVPDSSKWSLTERPGYLRLYASSVSGKGFFKAPNTINQRYMRSDSAVVTTRMEIAGMNNGQKAGLVHFNGGKNYAFIAVTKQNNVCRMEFEMDGQAAIGTELPSDQNVIFLRTSIEITDEAGFQYSFDGITYHKLGSVYPMKAANFRGDMIGVFTYDDGGQSGFVDVDWFHYQVSNR